MKGEVKVKVNCARKVFLGTHLYFHHLESWRKYYHAYYVRKEEYVCRDGKGVATGKIVRGSHLRSKYNFTRGAYAVNPGEVINVNSKNNIAPIN